MHKWLIWGISGMVAAVCPFLVLPDPLHSGQGLDGTLPRGERGPARGDDGAGLRRIALVIGNGAYETAPLKNPVNDARDLASKLKELDFYVTHLLNADQRTMEDAISHFGRELSGQDTVGLFYFAGHGLEVQGENYLVPIGARIGTEGDVRYEAVAAGRVLESMRLAGNELNLVVLDACRNNPYRRGFRSASGGLAQMHPASGTLIFYATEPGQVAADGPGRNGVFTGEFLQVLDRPGLAVHEVVQRTAQAVKSTTDGRQRPWQEGMIYGAFHFRPALRPALLPPPPVAYPPPAPPIAQTGYLQVSANVAGARVRVLGAPVGQVSPGAPLNLSRPLPVGEVEVRVSAPGYQAETRRVTIRVNQWAQVQFTLMSIAPAPPTTHASPEPEELAARALRAAQALIGQGRLDQALAEVRAGLGALPRFPELLQLRAELEGRIDELSMSRAQRKGIQHALTRLGFDTRGVDGAFGPQTRRAISRYQKQQSDAQTGWLTRSQRSALMRSAPPAERPTARPQASHPNLNDCLVVAGRTYCP